ncbi:MAG: hypothetical protein ACREEP_11065 [Dongiaceae bacterium]
MTGSTTITPGATCVLDGIAHGETIERNKGIWAHAFGDVRRAADQHCRSFI